MGVLREQRAQMSFHFKVEYKQSKQDPTRKGAKLFPADQTYSGRESAGMSGTVTPVYGPRR